MKEIILKVDVDGLDESSKKLDDFSNKAKDAGKSSTDLADGLKSLPGAAGQAANGVSGLLAQFKLLIANPVGLIITGIAAAVTGLAAIFKDFAPIMDFISDKLAYINGAFKGLQTTLFSFITTGKLTTENITEQADAMERASKMTRDYEDSLSSFNLAQAQYEAQIDKLLKQAKNKAISDGRANELIKEATRLQNLQIESLKNNNRTETAILVEKAKANGATYAQILAIQKGATVASLNLTSESAEEALRILQENYTKRVREEGNLAEKSEKIKNVSDSMEEKRNAKKLKAEEDAKKRTADELAREQKRIDKLVEIAAIESQIEDKKLEAKRKAWKEADDRYAKEEAEINRQRSLLEKDLNDTNVSYSQKLESLKLYLEAGLITEQEYIDKTNKVKDDEVTKEVKRKQQLNDFIVNSTMGALSILSSLNDSAAGQSEESQKKAFERNKKIQIAETLIQTWAGAAGAFAAATKNPITTIGPAYPFIQAGLAAAAGLAQVAKIRKTTFNGGGGGGASAPATSGGDVRPPENPYRNQEAPSSVISLTPKSEKQTPQKVYVVESDISKVQNRVSVIENNAKVV